MSWSKPRAGIKPVSDRRRSELAARRAVVAAALRRDGGCIGRGLVPSVACWGPLDGHEPLTRARGGDYLDLENVVTLCRAHHDWTHAHPALSTPLGLLRPGASRAAG